MQINYYPETARIRVRDPILRDEEIRGAALGVVKKICTIKTAQFNEKTSSILLEYEHDSLPMEKLNSLLPLARRLQSKVTFYTAKKKPEILSEIAKIESAVNSWS